MNTLLIAAAVAVGIPDEKAGEAVYRKQCLSCHGADGQGSDKHGDPLAGSRTLEKLAAYIAKTMPEDKPGTCTGEDAKNVAEYVYNAFYSSAARLKRNPVRVELSRLTVKQYRNAVAELLASPVPVPAWDERRGLKAEYFANRRARDGKPVLERLTPVLEEKLGTSSPNERISPEEFSIRWTGGLHAAETGEYEIVLDSANGVQLWLNDPEKPLIDARVRSGYEPLRATLILLGGRTYPLRVEFFKTKQDKTANIALRWKPPLRVEELVPERALSPLKFPETFVLQAPFPPDDRSLGFERGTSVSREWDEAATRAAFEVAHHVAAKLPALTGLKADAPELAAKARDWAKRFAERAFRRPLTPEDVAFFVGRHFEGSPDPAMAVQKIVLLVLKTPRFLYPELGAEGRDAFDVATRLSFGLWDSLPDAELFEAAKKNALDEAGVRRQAERMVADPRTRAKIRGFLHHWLNIDRLHELSKDPKLYPEFTEAVASDLRTSLDLLLDEVVWGDASDFRQLLLTDALYVSGRTAKLYGFNLPPEAGFNRMTLGPEKSAGVLSHPLLMAGFSDHASTSPIHRGVFIARSILGRRLRPPPDAVVPFSPDLHPTLTTRERVALQTKAQACMSCHTMVNPFGFALENFDMLGRWRAQEQGKAVDPSGEWTPLNGEPTPFKSHRALAEQLAKSEEVHAAFVEHLFQALTKQAVLAFGPGRPEALRKSFAAANFSIRKLLVEVMAASAPAARPAKGS